jgi:hypothetical protein
MFRNTIKSRIQQSEVILKELDSFFLIFIFYAFIFAIHKFKSYLISRNYSYQVFLHAGSKDFVSSIINSSLRGEPKLWQSKWHISRGSRPNFERSKFDDELCLMHHLVDFFDFDHHFL